MDLRFPPISASPAENWGLNFRYKILLISCAICIRPRVDLGNLGVPPQFNGSDGQKHGKCKIFQGWLAFIGKFDRRSPPILASLTENWGWIFCYQILLKNVPFTLGRRWISGQKHGKSKDFQAWLREKGVFSCKFNDFRGFVASPTENWALIFCYKILHIKCAIYSRPWVDLGVPPISMAPMARNTENPSFFKDCCWKREFSAANSTIFVPISSGSDGKKHGKSKLLLLEE